LPIRDPRLRSSRLLRTRGGFCWRPRGWRERLKQLRRVTQAVHIVQHASRHQATRTDQPRRPPDPPETNPRRTHTLVLRRRLTAPRCYGKTQVTPRIVFPSPTGSQVRPGPRLRRYAQTAAKPRKQDSCRSFSDPPCRYGRQPGRQVATWCGAEAGDLYAATRIARRMADACGRAGRGRRLPGTASPAGAVGREQ